MEFVNLELTKKLKLKGFEYKRVSLYDKHKCVDTNYATPTIAQVLKWLREKGIHAQIELSVLGWYGTLYTFSKDEKGLYDVNDLYLCIGDIYEDYEKAALHAIEYVLDNNLI